MANHWVVYPDHHPMKRFKVSYTVAADDWVTYVDDIFVSEQKANRVAIALNKLEARYDNG